MSQSERVILPSFGAGELSPALFARVDLAKYKVGAALLRNFFVDYRGGASNRAGSSQCAISATAYPNVPRVIPFIVATTNSYVIELGNKYATFYQNGVAGQSNLATPWAIADLPALKYTQSGSTLTVTHPSYPPYDIVLQSNGTFTCTQQAYGPQQQPPTGVTIGSTGPTGTDYYFGYVITAISPDGKEESLPTFPVIVSCPSLGATQVKITWTPPPGGASKYNVYGWGGKGGFNNNTPPPAVFGFISSTLGPSFVDDGSITPDFAKLPPQFQDPFSPGQIASVTASGGTLTNAYTALTITDPTGTGAAGYVLNSVISGSGNAIGVVITNPGKNYTNPTISAGGATYTATLGQTSNTYPAVCGYYQERRVFGASNNLPETLTFSQTAKYNNFDTTPVTLDSDAITATLAGRQVNYIQSLTPMNTGLVVMTSGGAFLVSGGGTQAAITPSNFSALPQASSGANNLQPLVINYDILYCQNRGAVVRDLAFNFYVQSYTGSDRSMLASHLFNKQTLVDWTWAEEPHRIVWVVRGDGRLLSLTYVPDQEMYAWARHDTNGLYKYICSVPEGQVNAVYAVVQRYLNGSWQNVIERFSDRQFNQLADAWFVDCGYKAPETSPAANITLSAATGTVTVTADQAVFASGDVGKELWANGGMGTVASYIDSKHITLNVSPLLPFPLVSPDDPNAVPLPAASGTWTYDTPITSVNVPWLANMTVAMLIDGVPQPQAVVPSNGTLVLPTPGTKVIVGLPFSSQLQTLRLDVGDPTIQGKRKLVTAVTLRVYETLGIQVGPDFVDLTDVQDLDAPYTPAALNTEDSIDARELLTSQWTKEAQVCVQQSNPLPCTVLGIIPEVTVGDTAR
jgi:hypothetical protein